MHHSAKQSLLIFCWVWDLSPQSQISLILRFILWMIMIVGKTNSTSATQIQPSPRSKGRRWITSRETTGLSAIIHSKIQGEWRCEASQIFRPFQISSKPKKNVQTFTSRQQNDFKNRPKHHENLWNPSKTRCLSQKIPPKPPRKKARRRWLLIMASSKSISESLKGSTVAFCTYQDGAKPW